MNEFLWSVLAASLIAICSACSDNGHEPDGAFPSKGNGEEGDNPQEEIVVEPLTADIRPLLVDGRKWIYGDSAGHVAYTATIVGDTIFDGGRCKILRRTYEPDYEEYFTPKVYGRLGQHLSPAILREDNDTVFQYTYNYHLSPVDTIMDPNYDDQWDRGMDLKRNPGEYVIGNRNCLEVESHGTVVVMGKTRRALKAKVVDSFGRDTQDYDYWIEGIGSTEGIVFDFYKGPMPTTVFSFPGILLECWDGDEKIFDWKKFNPADYKAE